MHKVKIAILVGMAGDAALQELVKAGFGPWGLHTYFARHGGVVAMFTAGGMMGFFTILGKQLGLGNGYPEWFAYGVGLDFIFRYTRIMPSLDDYYNDMSVALSAMWGGLPFVFVLAIKDFFKAYTTTTPSLYPSQFGLRLVQLSRTR